MFDFFHIRKRKADKEEALKQLHLHRIRAKAEQTLKASEVGYLSGKVDFLNLLESERMILQIKTGYFKNLSDSRKSLARLERLIGQDLSINNNPDLKEITNE